MKKMPCTQLTMEYLLKQGYHADIVERRINSFPFPTTKDLFGCFDIVAVEDNRDRKRIHFVQTTSASNRASRRKKIEAVGDVIHSLASMFNVVTISLITWKKKNGQYEVNVQHGKIEYGPDQKDHLIVSDVYFPTMKEVRAAWPKGKPWRRTWGERKGTPAPGAA